MIIVKEFYQGRPSGEKQIVPGTYAEDAEELFGLADYLVELGVAERSGPKGKASKADAQPDSAHADSPGSDVDATGRPAVKGDEKPAEASKDENADQGKADAQPDSAPGG